MRRQTCIPLLLALALTAPALRALGAAKAGWPVQLKSLLLAQRQALPERFTAAVESVAQKLGRSPRADEDFLAALAPHLPEAEFTRLRGMLKADPSRAGPEDLAKVHDAALATYKQVNQRAAELVRAVDRGYDDSDLEQHRQRLQDARVARELLRTRGHFLYDDDGEYSLAKKLKRAHAVLEKEAKEAAERRVQDAIRRAFKRALAPQAEETAVAGAESKPHLSGLSPVPRYEEAGERGGPRRIENAALGLAAAQARRLEYPEVHGVLRQVIEELLSRSQRLAADESSLLRFGRLVESAEVLHWASQPQGLHPLLAFMRLRYDQFETALSGLEREMRSPRLRTLTDRLTILLRKAGYTDSFYNPMAMEDPTFGDEAYDRELEQALAVQGLAVRDEALLNGVYMRMADIDLELALEAFLKSRAESPAERLGSIERWRRARSALFLATFPKAGPSRAALAGRLSELGLRSLLDELEGFLSSAETQGEAARGLDKLRALKKALDQAGLLPLSD